MMNRKGGAKSACKQNPGRPKRILSHGVWVLGEWYPPQDNLRVAVFWSRYRKYYFGNVISTDPSHGWSTVLYDDGDCLCHDLRPTSNLWYGVGDGPAAKQLDPPRLDSGRSYVRSLKRGPQKRTRTLQQPEFQVPKVESTEGTVTFHRAETQLNFRGVRSTSTASVPYMSAPEGDSFEEDGRFRSIRRRKQSAPTRLLDPSCVSSECDELVVAIPPVTQNLNREYHHLQETDIASVTDAEGPSSHLEAKRLACNASKAIPVALDMTAGEPDDSNANFLDCGANKVKVRPPRRLDWFVPRDLPDIGFG